MGERWHKGTGLVRSGDYWQALGSPPPELIALIPIPEGSSSEVDLVTQIGYDAHSDRGMAAPAPAANQRHRYCAFPPDQLQLQFRGMETGTRSACIRPATDGHFALSGLPGDDYMIRQAPDDQSRGKLRWGAGSGRAGRGQVAGLE
ncbi:hypothetical protein BUE93_21850 [Chromobacterium amazonense]|uniref:Uncharacterized protein n=1 Tax=Chromobacterium amazonense TaxID=1382803 RepID=A0A2S9WYR6_9NEIS|nr:hypothetical protein [Chromobacterium amazonense]PRP68536.1 hypothetical protein BUE93_21850 [Chromobacterium amazonense]